MEGTLPHVSTALWAHGYHCSQARVREVQPELTETGGCPPGACYEQTLGRPGGQTDR